MAKFRFCPPLKVATETPTTSPLPLSTGPPLLPGEIGAVIWRSLSVPTSRMLLTTPCENVPSNPCGLPTAKTGSPTWTASLLPRGRTGEPAAATLSTTRSRLGSTAVMPSRSCFVFWPTSFAYPRTAPSTTCKLLAISPAPTKKPLPRESGWPFASSMTNSTVEPKAFLAIACAVWAFTGFAPMSTKTAQPRSQFVVIRFIA